MAAATWRKLAAVMMISGLTCAPRAQAVEPASRPAGNAAPSPQATALLNAAVTDLLKEARAIYAAKPGQNPKIRDKADYFSDSPPEQITPAVILPALERSLDRDVRIDCYVKWQLLSAVQGSFPDELLPRVMTIYRRAPEPLDHPGLSHTKLSSALFRIGVMNKDAQPKLKEDYDAVLAASKLQNDSILNYRDALIARLPTGPDSFYVGLQDLAVRTRHGIPSQPIFDQFSASIKAWLAVGAPDPRALASLAKSLNDLKMLAADPRYQTFIGIEYHETGDHIGLSWAQQAPVDGTAIQNLIDTLKTASQPAAASGGGLNFKDDKK